MEAKASHGILAATRAVEAEDMGTGGPSALHTTLARRMPSGSLFGTDPARPSGSTSRR